MLSDGFFRRRNDPRNNPETAIQLAKQRFAALHPFDLADETWEQLFSDHRPGFVLEAIRQTSKNVTDQKLFTSGC